MSVSPYGFVKGDKPSLNSKKITDLVKEYGTPLYIIDEKTLKKNSLDIVNTLKKYTPNFLVAYAAKANINVGLLNILSDYGLGVDVVSGGELVTALKSKMDNQDIVFHGNNKSPEEIKLAVENNIRFVVDNPHELALIEQNAIQQTAKHVSCCVLNLKLKPTRMSTLKPVKLIPNLGLINMCLWTM